MHIRLNSFDFKSLGYKCLNLSERRQDGTVEGLELTSSHENIKTTSNCWKTINKKDWNQPKWQGDDRRGSFAIQSGSPEGQSSVPLARGQVPVPSTRNPATNLLGQTQLPGANTRSKRSYIPAACRMETIKRKAKGDSRGICSRWRNKMKL